MMTVCPFIALLPGDRHVSEIASMALDLLAGCVVFQIPHRPNARLNIRMGVHSGPACGVVAGTRIPNYCVMSDTSNMARIVERMGEGMRIHLSGTSKNLLDEVGGFRCEYRGLLDLGGRSKLAISSLDLDLSAPERTERILVVGGARSPGAEGGAGLSH